MEGVTSGRERPDRRQLQSAWGGISDGPELRGSSRDKERRIKGLHECHAMRRRELPSGVIVWLLGGWLGTLTSSNDI